jgi:hypothetical protein
MRESRSSGRQRRSLGTVVLANVVSVLHMDVEVASLRLLHEVDILLFLTLVIARGTWRNRARGGRRRRDSGGASRGLR